MLLFSCLFKSTTIDRSMFRKGSGRAGTGSSMIRQFTQKLENLPILENENVPSVSKSE